MAAIRSREWWCCCCMDMAQAAKVLTLLLLAVAVECSGGRSPANHASDGLCGSVDERTAVYPYWSLCDNPAVYTYSGGRYKLSSAKRGEQDLFLAPEWDETNSTYYIRLAKEGATYALSHLTREFRPYVTLANGWFILNVANNRVLNWRKEGGEEFLVEVEITSGLTFLQFAPYDGELFLPCPRIAGGECKGYSIKVYNTTIGLAPYVEDGVTYFKQSTTDLYPFTIRRPSTGLPLQKTTIASVV